MGCRYEAERARRGGGHRVAPLRSLLPVATCLALCACNITRLAVPTHPSAAQDAAANAALAGRPAVVTLRGGDDDEEQTVLAAKFDEEGNLAVGKPDVVESPGHSSASSVEWTRVPRERVVDISTVDRGRGALKGLLIGGVMGFVPTTIGFYVAMDSSGCVGHGMNTPPCPRPNEGSLFAASMLVGLGVALVTGGLGAAIGGAVGDGAAVTIVPDGPRRTAAAVR